MSNLRTRILGLATLATAFVGVSFGQVVVCNPGTSVPAGATAPTAYVPGAAPNTGTGVANLGVQVNPSLRAEAQTEMVAVFQFNCTVANVASNGTLSTPTGSPSTTGTIYVNTNLPITSKALTASNEATLILNGTDTVVNQNGQIILNTGKAYSGVVSGNQVTFNFTSNAAAIPSYPAVAVFEVTDVRVNTSSAAAPQVAESGLLSYVVPNTTGGLITANLALPAANGPGYILKSLGPPTITQGTPNPFTVCAGNPLPFVGTIGTSFTLTVNQLIPDTFLGVGNAASLLPGSEVGQYYSAATGAGASNADIIQVTISNLPSSATVYVPQTVGPFGTTGVGANNFSLTIAGSTVATATGAPATSVAYAVSGGSVTIPYTVTVVGQGDQTIPAAANPGGPINIPVSVAFAANSAAAQGPITANYSYAPAVATLTGPATAVPQFVASTFNAVSAQSIVNCQTTLLFPFVTNQVGFDTGIAIANTSTDNLGFGGKSFAQSESGTCNLFFYGPTAPTPASVADPQGNLTAGNVHTFQLSAVAAGYQGYMIAVCPFQYAHAYAFLFEGSGSTAVAQGYLAVVLGSRASTTYGDAVTTF